MLVYYQDFGSTSTYRIQNYSASLAVLKDRLHSGASRLSRRAPRATAAPAGRVGRRTSPLRAALRRRAFRAAPAPV